MASPELSRRVEKVVAYLPLCGMSKVQRREFHEALLEADTFEDLPGKWQAAILKAEQNRPARWPVQFERWIAALVAGRLRFAADGTRRRTQARNAGRVSVHVTAGLAAIAMALPLAPIGDFRQPVHVTGTSAQPRTAFVLERSGRVWRVGPRGRRLFLDARRFVRLREPRNHREDQGGAFALAVPPRHRPGGAVYLLYTRRDGRVHLDEFRPRRSHRSPTPRTVLSVRRTSSVDVGGEVAFGPDRLLYASFGFGHPPDSSQDPATLAGKLVRLNPRAEEPRAQVVASGMRVPWRFSFDVPTKTLIASDVGEVDFEEVNVLRLGVDEPANLGWPFFEGRNRRLAGGPAGPTQPVLAVRHGARMCAIVGGFLMRGPVPPRLRGRYVYGDVCSGQLRSVRLTHGHARDDRSERTVVPYLVSFGRDGRGRLYAVSLNGRVFRVL